MRFLPLFLVIIVAAALGALGMYQIQGVSREAEISALEKEVAALEIELETLKESLLRLTRQERLARFSVQGQEVRDGVRHTTIRFVEIDDQEREIGPPRIFTIEGDVVHIDALIIKFDDNLVISGDQSRGHPLLLFRRAYGDRQAPSSGFALDEIDEVPGGYDPKGSMTAWEKKLWSDFWEVANNPEAHEGVRAAHGVVYYMRAKPGSSYIVTLRASGELTTVARKAEP